MILPPQLRPPCVELSSISLKFKANLATSNDVLKALETAHNMLNDVTSKDGLDEKLAEYAFFPLSQVFNEAQRISVRCVELALRCLQILIEKGWRTKISPQMGKQLLILMNILAGGTPGQGQGQQSATASTVAKPRSEELVVAAFDCISSLCLALSGQDAAASIFNEVGAATIIDQTVYILLEGIVDGPSDGIQLSASMALKSLYSRITDRIVLASLLPRTVSSLTKTLRSTSVARRPYKVLCHCLDILTDDLRFVLNDAVVSEIKSKYQAAKQQTAADTIVLDKSWLNATTSQVKLALSNVIRLRNHDRAEVRNSLLNLCLMVIESCPVSLGESLPMMIETLVVLAHSDLQIHGDGAYAALKHVITSSGAVLGNLRSSLHAWIVALPRVMQSNDDTAKQNAIKQISTSFQALSATQSSSDILGDTMTTSLCDSVSATLQSSPKTLQPVVPSTDTVFDVSSLTDSLGSNTFQAVLFEQQSQRHTLVEIESMITKLGDTDTSFTMANSMINRLHHTSGNTYVASFWLALALLKNTPSDMLSFDDMLDMDAMGSSRSRPGLIEELYSISLPALTDLQNANPKDWRISALSLEAVALQAQQLRESFRPELIEALYPVLQLLGSNNPILRNHAMTCLNIITTSCGYPDTSTMLIENVDYLVNSVALKLSTFDISPQAPQVLLMMMKLCGARLIPYLDDLIGSIFAVLDAFHGYPKLVELLFAVLGTIVDEGAKKPAALNISYGDKNTPRQHRKQSCAPRTISDLVTDFKKRKERRIQALETDHNESIPQPHPELPWPSARKNPEEADGDTETDSQADQSPAHQEEEEKPLSKTHTLLLNTIKSIPPHLSSPSPFLRRSLLTVLTRGLPVLAFDEKSFLPLVNELWPSVSARITLPPALLSGSSSSLTTPGNTSPNSIDESGVQEETFVTVASCTAIGTMCKGAGDFMTSRIEHEFPRWEKLYANSWAQVRQDAEKAAERQNQRMLQQQPQQPPSKNTRPSIKIIEDEPSASTTTHKSITPYNQPSPLPPPPNITNKSFTPHHSLWKSLTTLFITVLSHVPVPADMGDEICHHLGEWITYFYPDLYFTPSWCRVNYDDENSDPTDGTDVADYKWSQGPKKEAERAIRAMDVWNSDLTWFIFTEGRARYRGYA